MSYLLRCPCVTVDSRSVLAQFQPCIAGSRHVFTLLFGAFKLHIALRLSTLRAVILIERRFRQRACLSCPQSAKRPMEIRTNTPMRETHSMIRSRCCKRAVEHDKRCVDAAPNVCMWFGYSSCAKLNEQRDVADCVYPPVLTGTLAGEHGIRQIAL